METARRLQPDNSTELAGLSYLARTLGNWAEAEALASQAVARDPLNPGVHNALAGTLYCQNRLDEAEAEYRKALELAPEEGFTRATLARALVGQGRLSQAVAVAADEPIEAYRLWSLALIYHAMNRQSEADAALEQIKTRMVVGNEDAVAWIYAAWGDSDNAFAWLERAIARRDSALTFFKCMPEAPIFTRDPRYKTLLRKMNLPE